MNKIELKNVGPIERLTIPIPEDGGVVVLRGRNGLGKTHAIEAVEGLYNKESRKALRPRDGHSLGTIEGLGVSIRLGRMNTSKGELVCDHLDGKMDPSQLVDPGIKDPEAADRRRLAAVIQLAGIKVDAHSWEKMLANRFTYIDTSEIQEDDPVESAAKIRRQLNSLALMVEKAAESSRSKAEACREMFQGIELEEGRTEAQIAGDLSSVVQRLVDLESQASQAESHNAWRASAQLSVEELRREIGNETAIRRFYSQACNDLLHARQEKQELESMIAESEAVLRDLKNRRASTEAAITSAAQAVDKANSECVSLEARKAKLSDLEESLNAASISPPDPKDIASLQEQKQLLMDEIGDRAAKAKAIEAWRNFTQFTKDAQTHDADAQSLRSLAKDTDKVLQESLRDAGFGCVSVEDGRLCAQTDRGMEPFSELSHGERWRIALDLAASGLPKGSILPVRQEAFEGLDPLNRLEISQLAKERGLVILTAEATDGELRAEEF